jgi:hypothetical protein
MVDLEESANVMARAEDAGAFFHLTTDSLPFVPRIFMLGSMSAGTAITQTI